VAAGILASRASGLVREGVFAHFFGASGVADAWRAALRMPNFLQNLLGEGSLSASFIPIYSELLEQGREGDASRLASAILGLLILASGLLAFLGILLAPILVSVVFAGFDPERQATTVGLVRILFPMTALLVVSAWALGVLNSHRRFFLPYVAPVAWNGAMIAAMVAGGVSWGLSGEELVRVLAWGALLGGALQLGVQLPQVIRLVGELRPSLALDAFGVREAIRNFTPVVTARGVVNLSGYLDYFLAAFLVTGSVAMIGYAQTLYLLPIALFGMSVAASELPELSRERGVDQARFGSDLSRGMERVVFFLIPSAIGYLVLGDLIVAAFFQRGAFGPDAVQVAWVVLGAYAVGMPASATSRLLSSSFYALRDTRTPARIAYLRIAISLIVALALIFPFDRVRVGELSLGPAGLALGASAGAWLEFLLLRRSLARMIGPHGVPGRRLGRMVVAGGVALLFALLCRPLLTGMVPWIGMIGGVGGFAAVYLGGTWILGVAEPLRGLTGLRGRSR